MKRNYQSGAQKRQAKRRKIAEAATNSQQLSSWLTRPKTSKADEQDVSIRDTESSLQLVDVNSFNNSTNEENFDTGRLSLIRQLWDRERAGLSTFPD